MGDDETRIAIIGTGFAGLGMAIRLKQAGIDDFVVLEKADDVGGTWRENTYPGAPCDVPSHLYSFSFAPNPDWTRTFPPQRRDPRATSRDCADRLRRPARTSASAARCAAPSGTTTRSAGRSRPATATLTARRPGRRHRRRCSEPSMPDSPASTRFEGRCFHSARWDHDARPAAASASPSIGTGASRHPVRPAHPARRRASSPSSSARRRGSCPSATAAITPLRAAGVRAASRRPAGHARGHLLGPRDARASGSSTQRFAKLARAAGAQAHRQAGRRPRAARARLTPSYTIGCKRMLISNDYYPALMQPNVELVTDGIAEIRPHAIVDRRRHASTRSTRSSSAPASTSPTRRRPSVVRGRDGRTLAETWRRQHAGLPGHDDRRLPEPLLPRRPQHGPRPQLDRVHDRVAAQLRPRRAAHDGRARGRVASTSGPRPRRPSTSASRRSCARRCGTRAAARAGTWTATAATPCCGRASPGPSGVCCATSTPSTTSSTRPRACREPEPVARAPRESPAGTAASPAPPSAR